MDRRKFLETLGTGAAAAALSAPGTSAHAQTTVPKTIASQHPPAVPDNLPPGGIMVWVAPPFDRCYPNAIYQILGRYHQIAARGENVAFQACLQNITDKPVKVKIEAECDGPFTPQVRRIGCVPVAHFTPDTPRDHLDGLDYLPGFVPDPLFPEQVALVGPYQNQAFYIDVDVPVDAKPGHYEVWAIYKVVDENGESEVARYSCRLDVAERVLPKRKNFPVTFWFYADALCDWYKVEPFSDEFWPIARAYMADLALHGVNVQYVPIFTPPTDCGRRHSQLLRITEPTPGTYEFDFSQVKKWVAMAREVGAEHFEWTHLFSQWGASHAIRIYKSTADGEEPLWPDDTGATSETYRKFLSAFLPAFGKFLRDENLLEISFFHISDEPHKPEWFENYRQARELVRELAPWMKTMDALSHVELVKEGLTDIAVPMIDKVADFHKAGYKDVWTYYCNVPRGKYLNHLLDTPLAKLRAAGFIHYKMETRGFLHWGYNYWHEHCTRNMIDPFVVADGARWPKIAYGDPFIVYPGKKGPISSLRWETFRHSLQDYALLQAIEVPLDSYLLSDVKGYDDFPWEEDWVLRARRHLLTDSWKP